MPEQDQTLPMRDDNVFCTYQHNNFGSLLNHCMAELMCFVHPCNLCLKIGAVDIFHLLLWKTWRQERRVDLGRIIMFCKESYNFHPVLLKTETAAGVWMFPYYSLWSNNFWIKSEWHKSNHFALESWSTNWNKIRYNLNQVKVDKPRPRKFKTVQIWGKLHVREFD